MGDMQQGHSRMALEGGAALEAVAAVGAIVLAILGLADVLPRYLAPIGTIVLGGAFLAEGGVNAARCSRVAGESLTSPDALGGLTSEVLAGIAGIVLGVLALIGIAPTLLLPIAVIAFGAALVMGGAITSRVSTSYQGAVPGERFGRTALLGASGAEVLAGIGACVLGILALIGLSPMTLVLVALLTLGGALFLNGTAVGAKLLGFLR